VDVNQAHGPMKYERLKQNIFPRLGPPLTITLLTVPVLAGLIGTILPAFGYLPALGGTTFSTAPIEMLFNEPGIWRSALLSFATGLAASVIALVIVMLFLASASSTTVAQISTVLSPLLSVPHAAAAFGLAFLIAPTGMIARMISPELTGWQTPPDVLIVNDQMGLTLIGGLIAKELPFLLLVALAALPQLPIRQSRQINASLGYGRIMGFLLTVWPALYAQMRLGVFAVIAFATSVVDVAIILGPQTPATLGVRLVAWMNDPDLTLRFVAAAGALLQLGVTLTAFIIWLALERVGRKLRESCAANGTRFPHDQPLRGFGVGAMLLPAIALIGGLITLAIWSVSGLWQFPDAMPSTVTPKGWMQALPRLSAPLATTLQLGFGASIIAALLAIFCLMREDETVHGQGFIRRHSLAIIYLPLLVPQAAFLFGLQFLFVSFQIDGMFLSLLAAHLVFVTPYVFLSLSDPWRAMDRRFLSMAAALGKSPWQSFFNVRGPMLLRAILSAIALGFAVSAAQYLATVLIGAGRLTTITTEAVALSSGGNRRVIGVYAFVQMLLPAIAFALASLVPAYLWRNRRGLSGH
jgi:putative thiamine transport system permease protein